MKKHLLIEKIKTALAAELENYARSARSAHAEATDEQNKAENKYDTRGLEASYLARGQSRQAAEVLQALEQYQALPLRGFSAHEPIDLGALVELERKKGAERSFFFIGPRAGGTEIEDEGEVVLVITPSSPMGKQLLGRRKGERLQISIGGSSESYLVVGVS